MSWSISRWRCSPTTITRGSLGAARISDRETNASGMRGIYVYLLYIWCPHISEELRVSPNKTLYMRDEDTPVWERAELAAETSRQSLSQLVTAALRHYLPTICTPGDAMEDIHVMVGDRVPPPHQVIDGETGRLLHGHPASPADYPRAEAFTGRWLVPPGGEAQSRATLQTTGYRYGVALTRRRQIAVYRYHPEALRPATLEAFPSLEEADLPTDIEEKAATALGQQRITWRDI
jgi:hypothetical protein